ncbi:alpha/beta hydrolase [Pseudonocardia acidicola]|uniref:Alpha/beta-hydrolase family protein n=1 Tax=Pseudonocardia acidicola TaxID=2724939 RepID=A0ABX1S6D3_9PSEU|nr:alpha/beta-hydrolase family protein [Pseudonocardia acidicola]NMH95911.1 hypothetical protein [Pseudonocardia acidicola]
MPASSADRPAIEAAGAPPAPTVAAARGNAAPPRGRFTRLRRYLRGLDHIGLVFALLAFLCSLTPSLLPRSWVLQGLVSGLSATAGYAIGVAVTEVGRRAGVPSLPARAHRRVRWGITGFAVIAVPAMLWLSASWQNDVRRAVAMPAQGHYLYLGVFAIGAAVFAGLIGLARLFGDLYNAVLRRMRRFIPVPALRLLAAGLITVLVVVLLNGALYHGLVLAADHAFSSVDRRTDAGALPPSSPLRSGGPGSLVSWNSLGRTGRDFVSSGPTVSDIEQLTGRPAVAPIRVYAGASSAASLRSQAELVLAELKRTGAFDRPLLAVATTTGTGSIDPTLADPLEYMYGGDTAIAALQYSHLPSWISFIVDRTRARQAGRTLFDEVYGYWADLPPDHRPRLVVCGESLGTFGGSAAFSGVADLTTRTQGALFVGPPNSTDLWRELTDQRVPGSPERLPVYGDGQTVRFAATPADLRAPDRSLPSPRAVFVQHASDPIVWWSTALIWTEPDWLAEPRGPDVVPAVRWYPLVTFWQITCDMIISLQPPPGHGHHYGAEVPIAWAAILHPPGWTDANTAALISPR